MRVVRAAALALVLAAALPALTSAHAQLVSSSPAPGQTLKTLPTFMVLTYDDVLRDDSTFVVLDQVGQTVITGSPHLVDPIPPGATNPSDPKSLIAGMPVLADGTYQVNWTAISADDGFIERGSFKFSVALASAAPSAQATDPGTTPPATPTPSAAGSPDAGGGIDVLIPIAIVGILVGVALGWFMRRRGPA